MFFLIHQPTSREPGPLPHPKPLAGLRGRARLDFGADQLLLGREAEGVLVHLARQRWDGHRLDMGKMGENMGWTSGVSKSEIKKNIKHKFVKSKVEMNRDDTIKQ